MLVKKKISLSIFQQQNSLPKSNFKISCKRLGTRRCCLARPAAGWEHPQLFFPAAIPYKPEQDCQFHLPAVIHFHFPCLMLNTIKQY